MDLVEQVIFGNNFNNNGWIKREFLERTFGKFNSLSLANYRSFTIDGTCTAN